MALNKNHPDCPAYTREWEELCRQMDEEIEKLPPPMLGARDGDGIGTIHKKYAKMIKELQRKYRHLFE